MKISKTQQLKKDSPKSNMTIQFSVLMSVYSKETAEHLKEAMDSVFNQTLPPTEVVLVEDGPLTDPLYATIDALCAQHPEIRIVRIDTNQGLGLALRKGLECCTYDLVARMDTDDISKPTRFEKQIRLFAEHPEVDICSAWIDEFVDVKEHVTHCRKLPETPDELYEFGKRRCPVNHPVCMYRKNAVLASGSYQYHPFLEDYYLWVRMMVNGCRFYCIQEPLLWFRANPEMFKRRGGLGYALEEFRLECLMHRIRYIGFGRLLKNVCIRFVTRLVPNGIRNLIYKQIRRQCV